MTAGRRRGIGRRALLLLAAACIPATGCHRGQAVGHSTTGSTAPERGGTLRLLGSSDVDHLATTSAYIIMTQTLLRAFTRQLFTYPSDSVYAIQSRPVADLATVVPTRENGGLSADRRTYTIHIRPGVKWDTDPSRDVTAGDEVRAMKLLCNPVSPVGAPGYYETTIEGMSSYCRAFGKVAGTVSAIKHFMATHEIRGVRAPNDSTVVFTLLQPATDFINILAMPFASPVPVEYLNYVPDGPTFRQHTISDGPYRITDYQPNTKIVLGRNPVWNPATDPVHKAYVDSITITEGMDAPAVQQQLEAGTADMAWDQQPPTADLASLIAAKDPDLVIGPPGGSFASNVYIVVNFLSPNEGGALRKLKVRQALEYAVDRAAVVQIVGGPAIARPLDEAVAQGSGGYRPGYDPYATPGSKGDPAKARQLLAEAGYPHGLTLKLLYLTIAQQPQIAETVQASLQRAGFHVQLIPSTNADFIARYLGNPQNARRGVWDLAIPLWVADWFGNNGRTVIQPLFDGRTYGPNSNNYGDYESPVTDSLIDRALAAPDVAHADSEWARAATQVMRDAAIVPLVEQKYPIYHSARVHNCIFSLQSFNCDVTAVWLKR